MGFIRVCFYHVTHSFSVYLYSVITRKSRNTLLKIDAISEL